MRKFSERVDEAQTALPRIATCAVLSGGHVLLGRRVDSGKWTLPGGHIDEGETPYQAAVRELQEEAGILSDALYSVGNQVVTGNSGRQVSVHSFYTMAPMKPATNSSDPDREISEWRWVPYQGTRGDELANLHNKEDCCLLSLGII